MVSSTGREEQEFISNFLDFCIQVSSSSSFYVIVSSHIFFILFFGPVFQQLVATTLIGHVGLRVVICRSMHTNSISPLSLLYYYYYFYILGGREGR